MYRFMYILFDKDKVYVKQISTVYRYNAVLLAATQFPQNDKPCALVLLCDMRWVQSTILRG